MTTPKCKPGDRVKVSSGKVGTLVRIGGSNDTVYIVLHDDQQGGCITVPRDIEAGKLIGLDIDAARARALYVDITEIEPIIDNKSPPGTRVSIKDNDNTREAIILRNDGDRCICGLVDQITKYRLGGHIQIGLDVEVNRQAAIKFGYDPDKGKFSFPDYGSMTYLASPQPKPTTPAFKPGDRIIVDGKEATFICVHSASDKSAIIHGKQYPGVITVKEHLEAAQSLGFDPNAPDYSSVPIKNIKLAPPKPIDQPPAQEAKPKTEVSLVPAMILLGTALGGFIGSLVQDTPTARVAEAALDVEPEVQAESEEQYASR